MGAAWQWYTAALGEYQLRKIILIINCRSCALWYAVISGLELLTCKCHSRACHTHVSSCSFGLIRSQTVESTLCHALKTRETPRGHGCPLHAWPYMHGGSPCIRGYDTILLTSFQPRAIIPIQTSAALDMVVLVLYRCTRPGAPPHRGLCQSGSGEVVEGVQLVIHHTHRIVDERCGWVEVE